MHLPDSIKVSKYQIFWYYQRIKVSKCLIVSKNQSIKVSNMSKYHNSDNHLCLFYDIPQILFLFDTFHNLILWFFDTFDTLILWFFDTIKHFDTLILWFFDTTPILWFDTFAFDSLIVSKFWYFDFLILSNEFDTIKESKYQTIWNYQRIKVSKYQKYQKWIWYYQRIKLSEAPPPLYRRILLGCTLLSRC